MNLAFEAVDGFVPILLRATWQASTLVVLVLAVRKVLGTRLGPGWRHALWCLVLARLLVPALPTSPVSMYWLDPTRATGPIDEPAESLGNSWSDPGPILTIEAPPDGEADRNSRAVGSNRTAVQGTSTDAARPENPVDRAEVPWSWPRVAGAAWLAGVLVLSTRTIVASVRLARSSRTWAEVEDPEALALLELCRRRMRIRRAIRLRITPDGFGPAVTGVVQPSILIPGSVLSSSSRDDLEHVVMHECAHVRRGDVLVQWLATAARIVHWFNPAAWFVVASIRSDRELACDADVLSRLGRGRGSAYGKTILKLASRCASPHPLPGLVGAFGSRSLLHERIAMIATHSTRKPGRGRLAGLVLILLAVVGLTDAAPPSAGIEATTPSAAPMPVPPPPDDAPPLDEATQERIDELIGVLREFTLQGDNRWASAMKDLAEIGEPAVPALIEELDRTTEDLSLRALGFTLRAIGDSRAVPALIRAIPRTLFDDGSDFGLRVEDQELFAFLKENDLNEDEQDAFRDSFLFGRAFREITRALNAITGQRFNEDELNFVCLFGGPPQRYLQRSAFHDLAIRWAAWWEEHRERFTEDPEFAKVSLPPFPSGPWELAEPGDRPFPTGPNVRAATALANVIIGPPQPLAYYRTFSDLDTRRSLGWPEALGDPEQADPEEVDDWAAGAGYDLRGIAYQPPGSETSVFGLHAVELQAWRVDNRLYETIEQELQANRLPELGQPAGPILADIDPETGAHRPENEATFLFMTRDGATGILQVTGQITELYRPEDFGQPSQRGVKTNRGLYRGVQFQYKLLYEEGSDR